VIILKLKTLNLYFSSLNEDSWQIVMHKLEEDDNLKLREAMILKNPLFALFWITHRFFGFLEDRRWCLSSKHLQTIISAASMKEHKMNMSIFSSKVFDNLDMKHHKPLTNKFLFFVGSSTNLIAVVSKQNGQYLVEVFRVDRGYARCIDSVLFSINVYKVEFSANSRFLLIQCSCDDMRYPIFVYRIEIHLQALILLHFPRHYTLFCGWWVENSLLCLNQGRYDDLYVNAQLVFIEMQDNKAFKMAVLMKNFIMEIYTRYRRRFIDIAAVLNGTILYVYVTFEPTRPPGSKKPEYFDFNGKPMTCYIGKLIFERTCTGFKLRKWESKTMNTYVLSMFTRNSSLYGIGICKSLTIGLDYDDNSVPILTNRLNNHFSMHWNPCLIEKYYFFEIDPSTFCINHSFIIDDLEYLNLDTFDKTFITSSYLQRQLPSQKDILLYIGDYPNGCTTKQPDSELSIRTCRACPPNKNEEWIMVRHLKHYGMERKIYIKNSFSHVALLNNFTIVVFANSTLHIYSPLDYDKPYITMVEVK